MLIGLITDTHHGARGDAITFTDYQKKFYDNVMFPAFEARGVRTVIHLGDVVDRRKYVNYYTAQRLMEDLIDPLHKNYTTAIIAGNHDVYHKNTNSVNCFTDLFKGYVSNNFRIYTDPSTILFNDGPPILALPWINSENRQSTFELIKNTSSRIVVGHLELNGFEMQRGMVCEHGFDTQPLDKFDLVLSGHFHQKSSKNHIHYLGSPFEITWADYNSPRGCHILNTDTLELEFIENPYKLFVIIYYDDSSNNFAKVMKAIPENVEGMFCKVIVKTKNNSYWYDQFITAIEQKQPHDLKTIERVIMLEGSDVQLHAEDTPTIVQRTINNIEANVNKRALSELFDKLYRQAAAVEGR